MPAHPFAPPYRIQTPRVILRSWEPADTPALRTLLDDKLREVRSWRATFDLDDAWYYALLGADDGALAGGLVVNRLAPGEVDVGGWVAGERGHRGYHTEAAAAFARAAFEVLGLTRVQAICEAENERSIALMRKLGFT